MTDSQAPDQEAPRRGDTGEDATARDWVGAEDPAAPDDGDAAADVTAADASALGPAAKAVKAAKATKAAKAVKATKAVKAVKAAKTAKAAKATKAPRKAAAKAPAKRKATKAAPPVDGPAHDEAMADQAVLDAAVLDAAVLDAATRDEAAPNAAAAASGEGGPDAAGRQADEPAAGAVEDLAIADDALGEAAQELGEAAPEQGDDLPDDEVRAEVARAEAAQDGPFAGSPPGSEVDAPDPAADDPDPAADDPAAADDGTSADAAEASGLPEGDGGRPVDGDAPVAGVRTDTSEGARTAAPPTADASGSAASAARPAPSAGPFDAGLVGSGLPGHAATAAPPTSAAPDAEPQPAPEPPRQIVRATGPARRPPIIVQGLWPALLAGGLVAATYVGLLPLAVAVLGVQVFLVLGALALLDAPASGGAFLVATGTTLAADAVVLADDGRVTGLAGVAALGLVASLLHQLLRKGRSRVTESLADTLVVIVGSVAAACLLALRQIEGGEEVLLVSLAAAGAVLLAGRIGDRIVPFPVLAVGATRGWPGLLLGLGAGVAAAVLVADLSAPTTATDLPLRSAALLGLVIASTVATADLAVDLGAAELRAGWRDARRVAALRPTALLLPYAVLGPVALLAGRLVLP